MKTLDDVIYTLRFEHVDSDTIADAVEYLRNYKDLLLQVRNFCYDTEYIKEHFIKKDLK